MTDWMNLRFDSFSQSPVQNVWRRWCAEKSSSITGSRPSALALSGSSALWPLMTRLIASFTAEGEYTLPVPDTNTKCLSFIFLHLSLQVKLLPDTPSLIPSYKVPNLYQVHPLLKVQQPQHPLQAQFLLKSDESKM